MDLMVPLRAAALRNARIVVVECLHGFKTQSLNPTLESNGFMETPFTLCFMWRALCAALHSDNNERMFDTNAPHLEL